MEKKKFSVEGMTCTSCEMLIAKKLSGMAGVASAKPNFRDNTVEVEYDANTVSEEKIHEALSLAGYPIRGKSSSVLVLLGAIAVFVGIYMVIDYLGISAGLGIAPIDPTTSYLLLFGIGLVTGLHCIAMCGGFVLSYSVKQKAGDMKPHLSYAAGKLASYTAIGALFGLLGSFIAFTIELRIAVAFLAGLFLIIYGFGMLSVLPKFLTSRLSMPGPITRLREELARRGPFATGIATGFFIACGPLQAMYILAAGSGSPIFGAFALFFFGLGTLPVMLGFSYVSTLISRAVATKITRYSGVLVVVLGLVMLNNAMVLSGVQLAPIVKGNSGTPQLSGSSGVLGGSSNPLLSGQGNETYQTIYMNVTRYGWEPDTFVLQTGVPVKWVIDAQGLTSCNNEIIVRDYGLDIKLKKGVQTVEFTPKNAGNVFWSCWMGMIPGQFIVTEGNTSGADAQTLISTQSAKTNGAKTGGSCGSGGCGCGCGVTG